MWYFIQQALRTDTVKKNSPPFSKKESQPNYLLQLLTEQSNLYHSHNEEKWKISPKTLKWSSNTPEEMRKFLGLIILMGQVRKENIRDYWSTDPILSTPIFPHTEYGPL